MSYMYKGKKVETKDLADIIYEQMTDDRFEECLNETWPHVEVIGIPYKVGTILRKVNYERFRELRLDDCDFLSREVTMDEDVANEYGIEWVEEEEEDE